jgi:hypothetical protein
MNLFYCRTPFIIEVDADASQIATKIELFIWNLGATEPTTPTHIIEKEIFTPTQYKGRYNISPFIADKTSYTNRVVNVKVKKYYKLVTDWILDEELEYVSAYGYTNTGGSTISINQSITLENSYYDKRYFRPSDFIVETFLIPKIDVVFDFDLYTTLRVVYTSSLGSDFVDYTGTGVELIQVPLTIDNAFFIDSNQVQLQYFDGTDYIPYETYNIENVCEPKFTPFIVSFINSRGGFSYLAFFKKSTIGNEVKGTDYNLQGLKQSLNINGTQNVKLNTGWVNEEMKLLIKELLLSKYVHLISADAITDGQAVVKTSSFIEKTNLNDKVINYEIDFELSTPLINNYV